MDAGASILAFVTAGLQSAKLAYDVVSAIKDGPQRIRDLESALGHLVTHLGYLEADPSLIPQKDAAIIQKCRDDLIQVRIDIEKLCVSDKDGKLKRVWKKIKPALKEKDIAQILAKVTAQTAAIGVYATVAQSTTVTEIHARQSEFHKENKTALDKQSTSITEVQARQSEFHKDHTTALDKQSADITSMASRQITIHNTVMGNKSILTNIASCQTTTQETLHQQQALLAASASRQEIFESKIFRDLELLLSDNAGSRAILEKLSALASKTSTSNGDGDAKAQAELQASIATLKTLVDEKSQIASGEHSASIRQAMRRILQFLIREVKAEPHVSCDLDQARAEDATQILEQIRDHFEQRPRGPLALDTLTSLNPASMRAPSLIRESRSLEGSTLMQFNVQQAGLYIKRSRFTSTPSRTRHVQDHESQQQGRQVDRYGAEMQSEMAIWSYQKGSAGGFMLKASVVEALNYYSGARAVLAPMIAVYRTIPSNSDVFRSILFGRTDEFIGLISSGKASLRDRDEKGASLLHYACLGPHSDICEFLLKHGADPDDGADIGDVKGSSSKFAVHIDERFSTPLGMSWSLETFPKRRVDTTLCIQYMDVRKAEVGHVRANISDARLTIDISQHLIKGQSLFSIACQGPFPKFTTFRLLVEAGVSVNGLSSHEPPPLILILKELMKTSRCCRLRWSCRDVKTIKYLIEKGADVHAKWQGQSCTAIAYGKDSDTSSYIGDVWDAALASAGHNVEEFRRQEQQPHSPRFWTSLHIRPESFLSASYRLTNFRDMWEGMENLCPYYDQVMSAGEGKVTIVGEECGDWWCDSRRGHAEELEDSSSEWETESEGGSE